MKFKNVDKASHEHLKIMYALIMNGLLKSIILAKKQVCSANVSKVELGLL
jgi:hypothetical protein